MKKKRQNCDFYCFCEISTPLRPMGTVEQEQKKADKVRHFSLRQGLHYLFSKITCCYLIAKQLERRKEFFYLIIAEYFKNK